MTEAPQKTEADFNRYLGDGVYASFDGFQVWLAVNHRANKVVALEPAVQIELMDYFRQVDTFRRTGK